MNTFFIKENDTSPSIAGTCERPNGSPVNITNATVLFKLRARGSDTVKVLAAADIVAGASGSVKYDWQAGDTDTAGMYDAEWLVTYSDGAIETFPNYSYQPVNVYDGI